MTSSRMKTWQKTFWQSNLAISRHETYPICTFGVPSCSLIFPFKVEIAEPIWHSILILLGRYGFPRRQMIISDVQWIYFYIYIHIFPELLINRPLDHHSSMTFPYFQIKSPYSTWWHQTWWDPNRQLHFQICCHNGGSTATATPMTSLSEGPWD